MEKALYLYTMKAIKQFMADNREWVIDYLTDEVRHTNVTVKKLAEALVNEDEAFNAAIAAITSVPSYSTVEKQAFEVVMKATMDKVDRYDAVASAELGEKIYNYNKQLSRNVFNSKF